jgi:hypothetical protein
MPMGTNIDYDGAINGAAANVKGTIVSKNPTTVDGRKGIEGLIKIPQGAFIRVKAVGIDNRLYQLQAIGPEPFVKSDDAEKFFGSFKAK